MGKNSSRDHTSGAAENLMRTMADMMKQKSGIDIGVDDKQVTDAIEHVENLDKAIKDTKKNAEQGIKPKVDLSDFDKMQNKMKKLNGEFTAAFNSKQKIDTKQIDNYLSHVQKVARETNKISESTAVNLARLSKLDAKGGTFLNGKNSDNRIKDILGNLSTKQIADIAKNIDTTGQYTKYLKESLADGIEQIPQYQKKIEDLFYELRIGPKDVTAFAKSFDVLKKEAEIAVKPLHEIILEMKNAPQSADFKGIISKKLGIPVSGELKDYFDKMFSSLVSDTDVTKVVERLSNVKTAYQDLQDTLQNKKKGMKSGTFIDIEMFKDLVDISEDAKKKVGELYDVIYQRRRIETGKNKGKYLESFKLVGEKNWAWVGKNGQLLDEQYHIVNELTEAKQRQRDIDKAIGQEQSKQLEAYTNLLRLTKQRAGSTNADDMISYAQQEAKERERICKYQENINAYEKEYIDLIKKRQGLTDEEAQKRWQEKMKFGMDQGRNISILDPKLYARAERNADITKDIVRQTNEKLKQEKIDEQQKKDEQDRKALEAEITAEIKKQEDAFNKVLEYERKAAEVTNPKMKTSLENSAQKEWQRIADIQDVIIEKQKKIADFKMDTPFSVGRSGNGIYFNDGIIQAKYDRNRDEIERIKLKQQEAQINADHEKQLKEQEITAKNIANLEKERIANEKELEKAMEKQVQVDVAIAKYKREQEAKATKARQQEIERLQKESVANKTARDKASQDAIKTSISEQKALYQAIQDKRIQINDVRLKQDEEQVKSLEIEKTNLVKRLMESEKRLKILDPSYSRSATVAGDYNKMRESANATISKNTDNFYTKELTKQLSLYREMQKVRLDLDKPENKDNTALKDRLQLLKSQFEQRSANLKLIDEERYKEFQEIELTGLALKQLSDMYQMRQKAKASQDKKTQIAAEVQEEQALLNKQKELVDQIWEERLTQSKRVTDAELQDSQRIEGELLDQLRIINEIIEAWGGVTKAKAEAYAKGVEKKYTKMISDEQKAQAKADEKDQKKQEKATATEEKGILDERLQKYKQLWAVREKIAKSAKDSDEYNVLTKQEGALQNSVKLLSKRLSLFIDEHKILQDEAKMQEIIANEEKMRAVAVKSRDAINSNNKTQNRFATLSEAANRYLLGNQGLAGMYEGIDPWLNDLQTSVNLINQLTKQADNLIKLPWNERKEAEAQLNAQYKDESANLKNIKAQIDGIKRDPNKKYIDETAITKQLASMEDFYMKNDGASKRMREQLRGVIAEMEKLRDAGKALPKDFNPIVTEFNKIQATMKKTGDTGMSIATKLGRAWKSQMASQIAMYTSFYSLIRYAKNAFNTIRELDTAMVDLSKTTKMSASEMSQFYYDANEAAKEYGVTTKDLIDMASQWSRLGYNDKESSTEMAKKSAQFQMISPGMDTQQSMDGLVSTMKAFGIEVENVEKDIIDKINIIGNTAATSNQEIVDMLTRSSAAMAEANNSLEDTIALETAAVEITRNAETTGTAFKTKFYCLCV